MSNVIEKKERNTHDRIRKPGSFKKTMDTIPLLLHARIQSIVMMTVSEDNFKELGAVMDAAEKAGADIFSIARYVPTFEDKTLGIPPLEYRKVLKVFADKRKEAIKRGSFTRFTIKDHLLTLHYYEEGQFKLPEYEHKAGDHMPAGCHCGNAMLTILPDGTVMGCRRAEDTVLGNVFTEDLYELWSEAKKTYRQYDKFEACSKCRLSPWCRGCPAIAAAVTGNYFGRDPQCWRVVER